MEIRSRAPGDMPALKTLVEAVYRDDGYPPWMPNGDSLNFLVSTDALAAWVATDRQHVVGHVALHSRSATSVVDLATRELGLQHHECGIIARLLVAKEARRRGLGARLLGLATQECRRLGLVPILDVSDEFTPAVSLYEDCGWRRLGAVNVQLPDGTHVREYVYTAPDDSDDHRDPQP